MLIFYTATIFLGALLLLLVQPMVGRMLLPLLGGAPAVWNTSMLFYQAVLLAGYAYAHFSTRRLGLRRQAAWHVALLVLPAFVLPIAIPHGWVPPTNHSPVFWLLGLLVVMAGLPFFVVSATSPLLQRWFSATGHKDGRDPYFLYAASNCGSLLALVIYPSLIEPHLRLSEQGQWWKIGYFLLALLTALCGLLLRRAPQNQGAAEDVVSRPVETLTVRRRWRWVLLAFVPCSLMLSVTTYITSEVAPVPLLWVIPLGIYLLTFILVFARRRWIPHAWCVRAMPFVVLPLIMALSRTLKAEAFIDLKWVMALHYIALFVIAMVCHGELANDRPSVTHLTEFFLWISAGGVLGGVFNALIAPVIFPTVIEYPVTLLLACALMPRLGPAGTSRNVRAMDFVWPAALGLLTIVFIPQMERSSIESRGLVLALEYGIPSVLCLLFVRRPLRFALGVLAILLAATFTLRSEIRTPVVARSFFGIHRVELFPGQEHIHIFRHGTTMHGMQSLNPRQSRIPLLYFTKTGPLGQIIATLPAELKQRVAVVGLGAGTVAAYADAGQQWTFYEIDPVVEQVARDPRYFTYLQECPAEVRIVLGDARLSLQAAADGQFGFMILDAYNSDTIPIHLLTREAFALYLQKLAPDGVLAFHITNRHLDLEPIFANLAPDAGLAALCQLDITSLDDFQRSGKMESRWVVLSRQPERLASLAADPRWHAPHARPGLQIWTDDYASVFSVFSW